MKSRVIIVLLLISWDAAQSETPSTGTDPTGNPVLPTGTVGGPDEQDDGETAGTVDPKQPLNAEEARVRCKRHETYQTCGTPCELTCANPLPVPCAFRCVRGCQCDSGYYRNQQGNCVELDDCTPKATCRNVRCRKGYVCQIIQGRPQCVSENPECGPNESYLQCGSACEPSCEKPNPGACTLQCVAGCQCDRGYYRNKQGSCVRLSECPAGQITCANILCLKGYVCKETGGKAECVQLPQCKPNETYLGCGTACEPSCDNPNPTVCTDNCVAGCQCDKGYYRNKQSGTCILLKDCPRTPPTCAAILCLKGYVCKVINGVAQCVQDIPQCKPNESYKSCGTACEPSCDKPVPGACTEQCVVGCQCNKDYYRDKNGACIRLADCPKIPTCKANEVYTQCKSACEPSCEKPNPTICPDICRPGCQCIKDYYRNSNGDCVRLNQCPPKEPAACQGKQCTTPGGCALVVPITCFLGFCNPQPQCVNSNPCASTTCEVNQQCVLRQVLCIIPPCNPTAECISSTSPVCGLNETSISCKNSCSERVCGRPPPVFCLPICIGSPGCACKSGYFRNSSGRCVTQDQC